MARAVERGAGWVDSDAFERGGEAVGIAFAPDLAVGDDVGAGPLLRPDGEQRGVVLRLGEMGRGNPPQLFRAHARRKAPGELFPVDQPFGLGITSHQRRWKQHLILSYELRRSEEHTSELQSRLHLVCRLLLEKKKKTSEAAAPRANQAYTRRARTYATRYAVR